MSFARKLSRREFGLLAGNVAMGSLAGGSLLAPRALVAQSLVANLSYYTSPNPQTYGKATGSFQKAFGDRAKAKVVDYIRRHCEFLGSAEKDQILGRNIAYLLQIKAS
jgi:hypothetical protein